MQKKYVVLVFSVVLISIATGLLVSQNPVSGNKNDETSIATPAILASQPADENFKWYSVMEAIELQKTTKKKVFIDVFTSWCGPCKMLEANTFSNPTIRGLLSEYYIPAKFNAESADTIVFNGQTFTNPKYSPTPRQSTHPFAIYIASTNQGLGYPTMVFLDENLQLIQPIPSYVTPDQLEPILTFFGTDAYKTTDWQTYLSTFKSNL